MKEQGTNNKTWGLLGKPIHTLVQKGATQNKSLHLSLFQKKDERIVEGGKEGR